MIAALLGVGAAIYVGLAIVNRSDMRVALANFVVAWLLIVMLVMDMRTTTKTVETQQPVHFVISTLKEA